MRKAVIAIGGASGVIYAKTLLEELDKVSDQLEEVGVVITKNAIHNWELEIGTFNPDDFPFRFYDTNDFKAPFASGSARYDLMIICPCSMGMLGRIASGISTDLVTRAADVILKERGKLILVPRETPLNVIHLENMTRVTLAGAIICPAIPSFYSKPKNVRSVILTVVHRVLDLAGLEISSYRWSEDS